MKSADQVREYVRRRTLEERKKLLNRPGGWYEGTPERVRELAFIEVLNAFDTPHKTKLKMPRCP